MDERVPRSKASHFTDADRAIAGLDARQIAEILTASCDIALVIEPDGVIADTAFSSGSIFEEIGKSWVGQKWADTGTEESRVKFASLMKDAADESATSWRQINHFTQRLGDVPVSYAIVGVNKFDQLIAVGRDMRKIADEQRRFMNAQLSSDRAFARLQASETRYRQIFNASKEAVLIVESDTTKVIEANTAAARFFGSAVNRLEGAKASDLIFKDDTDMRELLVKSALAGDTVSGVSIRGEDEQSFSVNVSIIREERGYSLVLRLWPGNLESMLAARVERITNLQILSDMPDGFLVTDSDGRVVFANRAFLTAMQIVDMGRLLGDRFDHWFDRAGVDCGVLLSNLREHGHVRRFATALKSASGGTHNVEIAGVLVGDSEQTYYGFIIRSVSGTDRSSPMNEGLLPYSGEQLTSLVGHMSLKDVVRETVGVIERLCIEAALELTGDNRASAAQLLGLSRQSLYDKLSRYGISDS